MSGGNELSLTLVVGVTIVVVVVVIVVVVVVVVVVAEVDGIIFQVFLLIPLKQDTYTLIRSISMGPTHHHRFQFCIS